MLVAGFAVCFAVGLNVGWLDLITLVSVVVSNGYQCIAAAGLMAGLNVDHFLRLQVIHELDHRFPVPLPSVREFDLAGEELSAVDSDAFETDGDRFCLMIRG